MIDQQDHPEMDPLIEELGHDDMAEENLNKEKSEHLEKPDRDRLSSIIWALILIWAGLVFLASNLGWLDRIPSLLQGIEGITITGLSAWAVIFLGAGVLVFLEAVIRNFVPAYRSTTGSNFFLAAILIGIGLGDIFGWELVWPFILIAMGLAALGSALIQNRR